MGDVKLQYVNILESHSVNQLMARAGFVLLNNKVSVRSVSSPPSIFPSFNCPSRLNGGMIQSTKRTGPNSST